MNRHCYKVILPKGFTRELKKDFELFIRSPHTNKQVDDMRIEVALRLNIPDANVTIASVEEYAEVAKVNALPPTQIAFKLF
jgi:hypothetical protein